MKNLFNYFPLILLFAGVSALAECEVRSASYLANDHEVGAVQNLIKTPMSGSCHVAFDLSVDGTVHSLIHESTGLGSEESLCQQAIQEARKELLLTLGGTFKTEATTVCGDGANKIQKIRKGDVVLESEVGPSAISKYFKHNNSRCRLFSNHIERNRNLAVYYGVICQLDTNGPNWIVVDIW